MLDTRCICFAVLFAVIMLVHTSLNAQSIIHQNPQSIEAGRSLSITYTISGITPEDIIETGIYFKTETALTYRKIAGDISNGSFTAVIPAQDEQSGAVNYYIYAELIGDRVVTLPQNNPQDNPFRLVVRAQEPVTQSEGAAHGLTYRIMAPLPGSKMVEDDAMVAITLLPRDDSPDPANLRLLVNGVDVTEQAEVNAYLVTYVPEGGRMRAGPLQVQLVLIEGDRTLPVVQWRADVVSAESRYARSSMGSNLTNGELRLTGRAQEASGNNYDFTRGNLMVYGNQGAFRYRVGGLLTSQESSRLQAQNQYSIHLSYDDWIRLDYGYVNPSLSPFLIAGRRVHGIDTQVSLFKKGLTFQIIYGEINRKIPVLYNDITLDVETLDIGGTTVTDTTFNLTLKPGGTGTYARDVMGARLAIGSGRFFQWGFNALKVKDDVASIRVINQYEGADLTPYLGSLSPVERTLLEQNTAFFSAQQGNPKPQDNVVVGSDFKINAHRNRIQFNTDVGASLLNTDITDGTLTQERADDLGFELDSDIISAFERIARIFVINENMSSLPIRINDGEGELFVPTGIFAMQNQLNLNYFNNSLTVQYRWIGPDFISLANNGLRRDIAGYSVTDRFRLLKNTVYVSLNYDYLWDNLNNQLDARTTTRNFGINTSWYPVDRTLPRITIGIRRQLRDNTIERENDFISQSLLQTAVRNVRQVISGTDTTVTTLPTPRQTATMQLNGVVSQYFEFLNASHEATLNYSRVYTEDKMFAYGDFNTNLFTVGISSSLADIPLRTTLNINYTRSEAQSGLSEFNLFGLNTGGTYFLMGNKLSITADISVLNSQSDIFELIINENDPDNLFDGYYEPDFSSSVKTKTTSFILNSGGNYRFMPNHQLSLNASFSNISNRLGNQTIPNDHFVQLRYIYTF